MDGAAACDADQSGTIVTTKVLLDADLCENKTQDENRSNVDYCDSDDIGPGCSKLTQPESIDFYSESSESTPTYYPSRGTSNSSNSSNDPYSDSNSGGDSSDTDNRP